MKHKHGDYSHNHEIDDGLAVDPIHVLNEQSGVAMHTLHNLFHLSVRCDCGYHGEVDTCGDYGFWWKWFLHVHAHSGHRFTIRGDPGSDMAMIIERGDPSRGFARYLY